MQMQKAGPVTVEELVHQAAIGAINIPPFQRKFVWKPRQVELFCDSLINGYPIGSLTLWKNDKEGTGPLWVIDGQQRITAFCILFDKKPYWYKKDKNGEEKWARLMELHRLYCKIKTQTKDVEPEINHKAGSRGYLSIQVDRILQCQSKNDVTDLVRQIVDNYPGEIDPSAIDKFQQITNTIWSIKEVKIAFQIVEFDDPLKAVESYQRLNETGTRVREPDTQLGFIAVYNEDWVTHTFWPFIDDLEKQKWPISPGDILRIMTMLSKGTPRPGAIKKEDKPIFWRSAPQIFSEIKESIDDILPRLARYGVTTKDVLPSDYALVALLALHARFLKRPMDFQKAFKWFILANLTGRYGDAALERLSDDCKVIYNAPSFNVAVDQLHSQIQAQTEDLVKPEAFLKSFKKILPEALLLRVLLWREAQDWSKGGLLSEHPPLQWHHIVPDKVCKDRELGGGDSIANLTLLSKDANASFKDKPPWEYGPKVGEDRLKSHFIPDEFAREFVEGEPISNQQEFDVFLKKRAKLISDEAARFLCGTGTE